MNYDDDEPPTPVVRTSKLQKMGGANAGPDSPTDGGPGGGLGGPGGGGGGGGTLMLKDNSMPKSKWYQITIPPPRELWQNLWRFYLIPGEPFLTWWDRFMVLVAVSNGTSIPFMAAFRYLDSSSIVGQYVIDVLYLIDIFLKFHVSYLDRGFYVIFPKEMALHYMRSWEFSFDLFTNLPFDLIALSWLHLPLNQVLYYLSIVRLHKLFRTFKLVWWFHKEEKRLNAQAVFQMYKFTIYITLITHWCTCIWYVLACPDQCITPSWATDPAQNPNFANRLSMYVYALYWTVMTMTTTGYGDVHATNDGERIWSIICMITGVFLYGYVSGTIASSLSNLDSRRVSYRQKVEAIKQYMLDQNMDKTMQKRVTGWYEYTWERNKGIDVINVFNDLPSNFRAEVALSLNEDIIEKVSIFKETSLGFRRMLSIAMRINFFTAETYIVHRGEIGKEMFFVVQGRVDVLNDDETESVGSMIEGSYFGEFMLILGHVCEASALAVCNCDVYVLSKDDYDKAVANYPEDGAKVLEATRVAHQQVLQRRVSQGPPGAPGASGAPGAGGRRGSHPHMDHGGADDPPPPPPATSIGTVVVGAQGTARVVRGSVMSIRNGANPASGAVIPQPGNWHIGMSSASMVSASSGAPPPVVSRPGGGGGRRPSIGYFVMDEADHRRIEQIKQDKRRKSLAGSRVSIASSAGTRQSNDMAEPPSQGGMPRKPSGSSARVVGSPSTPGGMNRVFSGSSAASDEDEMRRGGGGGGGSHPVGHASLAAFSAPATMPALPRSAAHTAMPPLIAAAARTATADPASSALPTRYLARRAPLPDGDGALRITDSPGSLIDPHTSVQVAKTGVTPNDNNASSSTSSDTSAVAVGSVVIYVLGALIAFVVLVYVLYWLLAFPLPWIRRWYQRHKSRRQLCRALSHSDKFPVFRFDPLAVRPRTTARNGSDTGPTSTAVTRANSPCASLTATDAFVSVAVELSPVIATRRIGDDLVPVVRGAARDDETGAFVAVPLDGDDGGAPVTALAADDDQAPLALAGALAMTPPPPIPRPAAAYAPMCTSPDVESTDAEVAHHAILIEYAAAAASDATSSCAGSSSRISSTASSRSSSCSSSMCSGSRPVSPQQRDARIVAVPLDQDEDPLPRSAADGGGEQDGFVSTTSLTCSICLEDYALNDTIRELPCHHDFHAKCVQPWLERALTDRVIACPVCRASWPLSSLTQDLHRTPTGTSSSTRARLRRWRHRTLSGLGTTSSNAPSAAAAAAPTTVTPPRAHHRLRRAVTATIDPSHHPRGHHHGLHRHGTTGAHIRSGTAASDTARRSAAHPRTLRGWAAVWNRNRARSGETTRDVVWSRSAATSPVSGGVIARGNEYAPLAPTTVQPQTTVVFAEVLPAPEPAHLGDE
ncbi:hypothetical protein AMAG_07148 [Allomyces macrogynus ATCC 38327]|uniref:Cyclic nucleotide-binding domain-containing protein n=1 Tax=Allomyces macrogynus (strain ATCC 38327) TaxID=578462 RepID=A0A0L0SHA1_ALLM3|nr:hypothetical protein AMAG_07148 [Allomyces macrogynus ATCC 38327]|eukprot:KNE61876.1 hypothetical protein AMAG_07148 [Allomyces macrogynus ATCC 38327]